MAFRQQSILSGLPLFSHKIYLLILKEQAHSLQTGKEYMYELDLLMGMIWAQAATPVRPRLASKTAWKMVLSRVEEVSSGKLEGATGGSGHKPRQL